MIATFGICFYEEFYIHRKWPMKWYLAATAFAAALCVATAFLPIPSWIHFMMSLVVIMAGMMFLIWNMEKR